LSPAENPLNGEPKASSSGEKDLNLPIGVMPLFILGDANGDNEITIEDRISIENVIGEPNNPIGCLVAADINQDGQLTTSDLEFFDNLIAPDLSSPEYVFVYNNQFKCNDSPEFASDLFLLSGTSARFYTIGKPISAIDMTSLNDGVTIIKNNEFNYFEISVSDNYLEDTVELEVRGIRSKPIEFTLDFPKKFTSSSSYGATPENPYSGAGFFGGSSYSGSSSEETCPQKDGLCLVLAIDFISSEAYYLFDYFSSSGDFAEHKAFEKMKQSLRDKSCIVFEATPEFRSMPTLPRSYGLLSSGQRHNIEQTKERNREHNLKGYLNVLKAIQGYQNALKGGGIKYATAIVSAHGSKSFINGACGIWTPGFLVELSSGVSFALSRSDFIYGNYLAANKKVCSENLVDNSCYSGLSVTAFTEAQNSQFPLCNSPPADKCKLHAGYDINTVMSITQANQVGYASQSIGAIEQIAVSVDPSTWISPGAFLDSSGGQKVSLTGYHCTP
jgi:hypothetical protein